MISVIWIGVHLRGTTSCCSNVFMKSGILRVEFLLDCSRSMAYGDNPSKFDHARRITACLAYIAISQLDRVSLTSFADGPVDQFPVTRGKHQLLTFLLRRMEELTTSGADTDLEAATKSLARRRGTGGLAVVISDFFDPHGWRKALDRLRYHQYEVYLVRVF